MPKDNTQAKPETSKQPTDDGLSTSTLFSVECCPECGSRELTWHADVKNYGGVQDGRICMREVGPIFYLGCDECSETIKIVAGDVVARMLTEMQAENKKEASGADKHR